MEARKQRMEGIFSWLDIIVWFPADISKTQPNAYVGKTLRFFKYRENLLWKKNKFGTKNKNMVATSHMQLPSTLNMASTTDVL